MTLSPVSRIPRPSTWFTWHGHVIGSGARVLDLACGDGRHSLAAAALGARVVAVDRDESRLATGRELAAEQGLEIAWRAADLEGDWPDFGRFDAVLLFNYLDRVRMPAVRELIGPGGFLLMETFLVAQRELGWGPSSDHHLLQPAEIGRLAAPLTVLHGREVLEAIDAERWRAVASVVAVKK